MAIVDYQPDRDGLDLLTTREVAKRLGVSTELVRQLISSGALDAVEYTPQVRTFVRVTPDALRRHIQATTAKREPTTIRRR